MEAMGTQSDEMRHYQVVVENVDKHEPGCTEPDEMKVLEDLYGKPDEDGVFRGDSE